MTLGTLHYYSDRRQQKRVEDTIFAILGLIGVLFIISSAPNFFSNLLNLPLEFCEKACFIIFAWVITTPLRHPPRT